MTTTEVLNEIQKMPPDEKHRVWVELGEQLDEDEKIDLNAKERKFVNGLRQKGLVTDVPTRFPDDEFRRNFKRVEIKGKSLSETIIEERG